LIKYGVDRGCLKEFSISGTSQNTVRHIQNLADKLIKFFGTDYPLQKITAEQAIDFINEIKQGAAEASVARWTKRARQIFKAAVKRKIIAENPFDGIKTGSMVNKENEYIVSIEETNALLDACTNPQQRLIIILARYGGLRVPQELTRLKWSDIDWEKKRFKIYSPKTKSERNIPLFPEIEKALSELYETLPEGSPDRIFPDFTEKKSLGSFWAKTAKRAGIVLWARPADNMRATRERLFSASRATYRQTRKAGREIGRGTRRNCVARA
jgi:integrase